MSYNIMYYTIIYETSRILYHAINKHMSEYVRAYVIII